DRSNLGRDLLGDRDAILAPSYVERKTLRFAAGLADVFGGIRRRLHVDVERHDAGAFAGITRRDRAPDPGAGASDNGDAILQESHGCFLSVLFLWAWWTDELRTDRLVNGAAVAHDIVMRGHELLQRRVDVVEI